ncbi:MAG: TrbC family F-type conjugative pilus assembly protein [Pseudomonadota bacterium]
MDEIARRGRVSVMSVFGEAVDRAPPAGSQAARQAAPRYIVFVSESLGRGALRALGDRSLARGDTALVFRGLRRDESIGALAARWIRDVGRAPVALDPRPFREYGIDRVPAVLDTETGTVVFGTADPDYAATRADRSVVGPTAAIVEVDLARLIHERAAGVDWRGRAKASLKAFWDRQVFAPLSQAPERRERLIDPRVRLGRDLVLPDGTRLAAAGDIVNPMAVMPFSLTLCVFDARDPAEVALVERLLPGVTHPVLMLTGIDTAEGWQAHRRLRERLGEAVYLLTDEVRARFRLRHTVSIVTARDGLFVVDEIPPDPVDRTHGGLE